MNNTQFDIWFERVKEDSDSLKSLIGELLEKQILVWSDQRLLVSSESEDNSFEVKRLERENEKLEDKISDLENTISFLEQEAKYLKENLG